MQKIKISLAILLTLISGLPLYAQALNIEGGEKRTFTITGYYSPLPHQNFYVTGDYKSEIRLNGKGKYGADGTPVYPGMMAASGSYPYGTKICIPDFGCGMVHDRGQAIVNKGERDLARHDRLDLWMGYGEEGLLRALSWGVRHIECEVFDPESDIQIAVNFQAALPIAQILDIPEKKEYLENLRRGAEGESVKALQEALAQLYFYKGVIDGIYDYDLRQAVLAFQKKHFIIEGEGDLGAGMFGPQTRKKLSEVVHHAEVERRIREAWEAFHFEDPLRRGAKNASVLLLQEILVKEEFLNAYPTGYFGPQTEKALAEFQLHHGIIDTLEDYGAGRVGPLTRDLLNEFLAMNKEVKQQEEAAVVAYQKRQHRLKYLASRNFHVNQSLSFGDQGEAVMGLQRALQTLGYLIEPPTGFYDEETRSAVRVFQLDQGIVQTLETRGAGVFGPSTRLTLQSILQG